MKSQILNIIDLNVAHCLRVEMRRSREPLENLKSGRVDFVQQLDRFRRNEHRSGFGNRGLESGRRLRHRGQHPSHRRRQHVLGRRRRRQRLLQAQEKIEAARVRSLCCDRSRSFFRFVIFRRRVGGLGLGLRRGLPLRRPREAPPAKEESGLINQYKFEPDRAMRQDRRAAGGARGDQASAGPAKQAWVGSTSTLFPTRITRAPQLAPLVDWCVSGRSP